MSCRCFPANETCPSECVCDEPHITLESGMVRSDDTGKPDYTLIDLDLLERWAVHMTKNVASKGANNWRLAHTEDDRQRFKASFWRHAIAWARGETDEDHAVAMIFNIGGAEHVTRQLDS
jgi:hypothetical protein